MEAGESKLASPSPIIAAALAGPTAAAYAGGPRTTATFATTTATYATTTLAPPRAELFCSVLVGGR